MNKTIEQRINTYGSYLKRKYGRRIFRVGLSINRECPHRLQTGGCSFCLPDTYTDNSLDNQTDPYKQLEQLIPKIKIGCGDVGLLAYFHHNTSTAGETEDLKQIFSQALKHSKIAGLIISTRPDYLNDEIVAMLSKLKGEVFLEIGLQSIHQKSLDLLNRGHTLQDFAQAMELCKEYGIDSGVHLIPGIPGETLSDMLATIAYLNDLPQVSQIKFHNLVVYRGTKLASEPEALLREIPGLTPYLALLATLLQHTRGDKVISRFFTSNVRRTNVSLNSFPGYKHNWLNKLTGYLNEHDIYQGSATPLPYKAIN
jgi:hypothetical protein